MPLSYPADAVSALALTAPVALVPERLARCYGDRLELFAPPVDVPGFDLHMLWHDRTHDHPAHQWLRSEIASFCARS